MDPTSVAKRDTLNRINADLISREEFIERYERPIKPVIITNITKTWSAQDKWTLNYFLKQYRNERFKCGEDDNGYNVKMKIKYFVHYMSTNCDDSPLYIFDGNFGEVSYVMVAYETCLPQEYKRLIQSITFGLNFSIQERNICSVITRFQSILTRTSSNMLAKINDHHIGGLLLEVLDQVRAYISIHLAQAPGTPY